LDPAVFLTAAFLAVVLVEVLALAFLVARIRSLVPLWNWWKETSWSWLAENSFTGTDTGPVKISV